MYKEISVCPLSGGAPTVYKDDMMNVLVLNSGSSSLKYKLIKMPGGNELIKGEAERVGIKTSGKSRIIHSVLGRERIIETPMEDHNAALKAALCLLADDFLIDPGMRFDVFAHRYVHPGTFFSSTVKITRSVLTKLKKTFSLAPIHNPVSYRLMEFCHKKYPGVPQFAVFDTSFHRSILPEFSNYAIPFKIAKKYGIKKVGFHGLSHKYVSEEACRFVSKEASTQRLISCHLGTGGSSVCAIKAGKSINNSMGFTPLEGLMMNTRCGDIDPGAVFYIMFKEKFSVGEADRMLNNRSGVLGVFNSSSDLRDAIKEMGSDRTAKMTVDMYVRRVRTYLCFYALILKKADILVFTDSLGQGSSVLREHICLNLGFMGIMLDKERNDSYAGGIAEISSGLSETRVLVVPTDEEAMIAREAYKETCKDDTSC